MVTRLDFIQKSVRNCEKRNLGSKENRSDEEGEEGVWTLSSISLNNWMMGSLPEVENNRDRVRSMKRVNHWIDVHSRACPVLSPLWERQPIWLPNTLLIAGVTGLRIWLKSSQLIAKASQQWYVLAWKNCPDNKVLSNVNGLVRSQQRNRRLWWTMVSRRQIKVGVSYCAESDRDAPGTPCQLPTGMGREMLVQSSAVDGFPYLYLMTHSLSLQVMPVILCCL